MLDNVILGTLPKMQVIACVENASMSGQYTMNALMFNHHDLNFMCVYVDGQPVPSKPFEVNFEKNNYIRAYHSQFSGFNRDRGNYISREEFAKGSTLFTFDLSQDMYGNEGHLNVQYQGNLHVEIKFSKALEKSVLGIV